MTFLGLRRARPECALCKCVCVGIFVVVYKSFCHSSSATHQRQQNSIVCARQIVLSRSVASANSETTGCQLVYIKSVRSDKNQSDVIRVRNRVQFLERTHSIDENNLEQVKAASGIFNRRTSCTCDIINNIKLYTSLCLTQIYNVFVPNCIRRMPRTLFRYI